MTTISALQDKAVKEIETIFEASGYIDGSDFMEESEIRAAKAPIYYRLTTPAAASAANIVKKGSKPDQAMLFLLYALVSPDFMASGNRTQIVRQTLSITLQYNNKHLFRQNAPGEPLNKFAYYLSDLLTNLEANEWAIEETIAEEAFEATEGAEMFNFRKQFLVEKNFLEA